jgi:Putative zinc-finger
MVIKCDDVLSKISHYVEDDLDPALKRVLEEHISQCRHCRAVLEGAGNVVAVYGDRNMFSLPAGFHSRLRLRLADQIEGQRGSWQGWLVSMAAAGALAAAFLFAAARDRFVPQPRAEMSQPARRMPQQLVAVVEGGKTFHVPGCPYMHGKHRMVTPEEAIREGYTPCSRCMSEALRTAGNGDPDSEGLEIASSATPTK